MESSQGEEASDLNFYPSSVHAHTLWQFGEERDVTVPESRFFMPALLSPYLVFNPSTL